MVYKDLQNSVQESQKEPFFLAASSSPSTPVPPWATPSAASVGGGGHTWQPYPRPAEGWAISAEELGVNPAPTVELGLGPSAELNKRQESLRE